MEKENIETMKELRDPPRSYLEAYDTFLLEPENKYKMELSQAEAVSNSPVLTAYLDDVTSMYLKAEIRINGFVPGFYEMRFALITINGAFPNIDVSTTLAILNRHKHAKLIDPQKYKKKYPNLMSWVDKEKDELNNLTPRGVGRMNIFALAHHQLNSKGESKRYWSRK